jgi:alanine racemase
MNDPGGRWAWAEVDAAAIEHNVAVVRAAAGGTPVWAVVKADGYGHGALLAAEAALRGGADGLCVALVQEGVQLREAGVSAPVLVFGEQPPAELDAAVRHDLVSTVYSLGQVAELDRVARAAGVVHRVHLKIDSGMHRVGCDPTDAVAIAEAIVAAPGLRLEGVYSHLAVADERPDAAALRREQPAVLEVAQETRLVDRVDRAQSHRGAGELPERRHQPGMGIRRQATATGLAPVVVELVLVDTPLQEGTRVDTGGRVRLEIDQVAVLPTTEEMIEADIVEGGSRGETGNVSAVLR